MTNIVVKLQTLGIKVDESFIEYARQSGKLVLDYQNPENYADACNEFYDQVWEATANEEE